MNIGIYSPDLDTFTLNEKYLLAAASLLSFEHKVTIFWDDTLILKKAAEKFSLDLSRVNISSNVFSGKTNFLKRFLSTLSFDRLLFSSKGSIPFVGAKKLLVLFQKPVGGMNTDSFAFIFRKSRVSKFVTVSHYTKKFIDSKFGSESIVLYPPSMSDINIDAQKENMILSVIELDYASVKRHIKEVETVLLAFKMFQKKRLKGWRLVICCNTSLNEDDCIKLEKKITHKKAQLVLNPSLDSIIELLSKAKIYWQATGFKENLEEFPERAEQFGTFALDAMSYGAVPMLINKGGLPEIIIDNENGYLWDSIEELVENTHRICVDNKKFQDMSEKAIDTSANFSIERFKQDLNHLIW